MEALPDLSRPSMQQINEGNPVSLNMVNECVSRRSNSGPWRPAMSLCDLLCCCSFMPECHPSWRRYTRLYTKDQLQLVPQESPWGFTEDAELINGR